MKETVLQVHGMTCSHCVHSIFNELRKVGVSATIDLKAGTVTVGDEHCRSLETIVKAIEGLGYYVQK